MDIVIDLGLFLVGSDLWRQRVEDVKEMDQSPIDMRRAQVNNLHFIIWSAALHQCNFSHASWFYLDEGPPEKASMTFSGVMTL